SLKDLADIPVAVKNGTAVLVKDLGTVNFGPAPRRGVADWQGEGQTVGGIVVMRYGENALKVIQAVKAKLAEIAPSLPPGVTIRSLRPLGSHRGFGPHPRARSHRRGAGGEPRDCTVPVAFPLGADPDSLHPDRGSSPRSSRCTSCTSRATSCPSGGLRSRSGCWSMPPWSWSRTATDGSPKRMPAPRDRRP
ncbi:heavy metal efflux pump, CzcA family, partial [mine drainage metagenome]